MGIFLKTESDSFYEGHATNILIWLISLVRILASEPDPEAQVFTDH
jgi:hypothetical protein